MIWPCVLLLGAIAPADLEAQARREVGLQFERIGRNTPRTDEALSRAARSLAERALDSGAVSDAVDAWVIAEAVSDSGATDAIPRALVLRGPASDEAIRAIASRRELSEDPANQAGVGASVRGDRSAIVILLSQRKAELAPFARQLPKAGVTHTLCGQLAEPLDRAEVFVTRPEGEVIKVPLSRQTGPGFCARLSFASPGRYAVEVLGHGPQGPEVAALFFVDAGVAFHPSARPRLVEPDTAAGARGLLVDRINALRRAQGASPLEADDALSRIAQAYSDRMADQNFFAHVAPEGDDLRARLLGAGYPYQNAGENLGLASGPVAAHFGIEHSPGHRKNLLEPAFTRVGVGVAFQTISGRKQAVVTEILATPARRSQSPVRDAYQAVAGSRAALHLPPLVRSEVLEKLAAEHALSALRSGTPSSEPTHSDLHQRVFAALDDVRSASVDFFILDDPAQMTPSKALRDSQNDRIGIGAVQGDSTTYGKAKFWVVVIYAASR